MRWVWQLLWLTGAVFLFSVWVMLESGRGDSSETVKQLESYFSARSGKITDGSGSVSITNKKRELHRQDSHVIALGHIRLPADRNSSDHHPARDSSVQREMISRSASVEIARSSSYDGNILLDWVLDGDSFSYINYKSLESLLFIYPQANFIVYILGPESANYYKVGNIISKMAFRKYDRMGYKITVKIVHALKDYRSTDLGARYWERYFSACCTMKKANDLRTDKEIPFHLYFYHRLRALHNRGGIFVDFSWLHIQPLDTTILAARSHPPSDTKVARADSSANGMSIPSMPKIYNGAWMKIFQHIDISKYGAERIDDDASTGKHGGQGHPAGSDREQKGDGSGSSRAFSAQQSTSMVMAFSAGNPVLRCVLERYDDEQSVLRRCIHREEAAMREAADKAFDSAASENKRDGKEQESKKSRLQRVRDGLKNSKQALGAQCTHVALTECFVECGRENALADLPSSFIRPQVVSSVFSSPSSRDIGVGLKVDRRGGGEPDDASDVRDLRVVKIKKAESEAYNRLVWQTPLSVKIHRKGDYLESAQIEKSGELAHGALSEESTALQLLFSWADTSCGDPLGAAFEKASGPQTTGAVKNCTSPLWQIADTRMDVKSALARLLRGVDLEMDILELPDSKAVGSGGAAPVLLWLGERAYDGAWHIPEHASLLHHLVRVVCRLPYQPASVLERASKLSGVGARMHWKLLREANYPAEELAQFQIKHTLQCLTPNTAGTGDGEEGRKAETSGEGAICPDHESWTSRQCAGCHEYAVATRSVRAQSTNSSSTGLQYWRMDAAERQARSSCALSFVMPGFMKAGTTYLFDSLMMHPQALRALRGVVFKETGCYTQDSMQGAKAAQRMNCFPFLENAAFTSSSSSSSSSSVFSSTVSDDRGAATSITRNKKGQEGRKQKLHLPLPAYPSPPLHYGDGTVFYAARKESPEYIVRDNPSVRALFVTRDPVARSASHHRFSYTFLRSKGFGDMNKVVQLALNRSEGPLMDWYDLAVAADDEKEDLSEKRRRVDALVARYQRGLRDNTKAADESVIEGKGAKRRAIGGGDGGGRSGMGSKRRQISQQQHPFYWRSTQIVFHSIYFPAIYHWLSKLPRNQIMVLKAEEFKPNYLSLREIEPFLRNRCLSIAETCASPSKACASNASRAAAPGRSSSYSDATQCVQAISEARKLLERHSQLSTMGESQLRDGTNCEGKGGGDGARLGMQGMVGGTSNNREAWQEEEEREEEEARLRLSAFERAQRLRLYETVLQDLYLSEKLNEVYRFLGWCPWHFVDRSVLAHKTDRDLVPPEHSLRADTRTQLAEFYRPFSSLLQDLLSGQL